MPEHDRAFDAEPAESVAQHAGLRLRGPSDLARAFAMAEAWAIEHDDAVCLGRKIDRSAQGHVIDHRAVAVQKHQRFAMATLDVVKANATCLDKSSARGGFSLRVSRAVTSEKSRRGERCRYSKNYG